MTQTAKGCEVDSFLSFNSMELHVLHGDSSFSSRGESFEPTSCHQSVFHKSHFDAITLDLI